MPAETVTVFRERLQTEAVLTGQSVKWFDGSHSTGPFHSGRIAGPTGCDNRSSSPRAEAMTDACSDPNLLLGEYALRMEFITQDKLQDVLEAWTLEECGSLEEMLVERGHISSSQRDALLQLVERHLQQREAETGAETGADQHPTHLADDARSADNAAETGTETETAADGLPLPPTVDADTHAGPLQLVDLSIPFSELESQLDQSGDFQQEGLTLEEPAQREMRFQILRPHAEGGIGVVSVALDREFHREVAFKEIKRQFRTQKGARKRFLLEAEVTARLEHPGIVPVYGLGHFPDGRRFGSGK